MDFIICHYNLKRHYYNVVLKGIDTNDPALTLPLRAHRLVNTLAISSSILCIYSNCQPLNNSATSN